MDRPITAKAGRGCAGADDATQKQLEVSHGPGISPVIFMPALFVLYGESRMKIK
jgi:hypothetical protein